MSVKEYSFKFIILYKNASSLVSSFMDEIRHFLMGMLKELEEECNAAMLHNNIVLSRMIVHTQKVEYSNQRKNNRETKKSRFYESGYSKNRFNVQDKPMLRICIQEKFLQVSARIVMIEVLILNLKKGEMLIHQEKYQLVVCLVRNFWVNALLENYWCGKGGHMMKDFPNVRSNSKGITNINQVS